MPTPFQRQMEAVGWMIAKNHRVAAAVEASGVPSEVVIQHFALMGRDRFAMAFADIEGTLDALRVQYLAICDERGVHP